MINCFSLDNIFLDKRFKTTFENYCIRKKLITRSDGDEEDVLPIELEIIPESLVGIKKLLILLTLFENIDSDPSGYDLSRLIESGLIRADSAFNSKVNKPEIYNEKYKQIAIDLMKLYKKDIIKYIKQCDRNSLKGLKKYSENKEFWQNMNTNMRTFCCISPEGKKLDLVNDYDQIVENCEECLPVDLIEYLFFNCAIDTNLSAILWNLMEGIHYSEKYSVPFTSYIFSDSSIPLIKNIKYIDDIYYTIRIHLPKEMNILPMPQTFEEVMRMRKSPYIKSFRKVMNEWSTYISKGEFELAAKMKKDIIKANKGLENLERYKVFYNSLGSRVCKFIGGLIPYLSIAIGTVDFLEPYGTKYLQNKNGWVILTKQ